MNRILKIMALCTIGGIIGAGIAFYWSSSQLSKMRELSALMIVSDAEEEAAYLYKNAEPEIAIYKFERTLKLKEDLDQAGVKYGPPKTKGASWFDGLTYGRIGLLYKKIGQEDKAADYLGRALEFFRISGWLLADERELLKAIEMLDTKSYVEVMKSIGTLVLNKSELPNNPVQPTAKGGG